ncbi:glycosyl transferase [Desulfosarcina widdelii]|uniref:Glycosyl transferase n=1 Tax=Desulfosarcina widdelii TaxID=947919 RepID=A0A5K7Z060_9BACT|nr:glycosyl transferase [Desulfosarcina widdelii]BBO73553.1 glycosyl transferase [Desulfosarcina widdelii]
MLDKNQLWLAFAAFSLCLTFTPIVRLVATKKEWVAKPKEDRWHKKTTALMGGIAIFIGIAVPLFIIGDFSIFWKKILAGASFKKPPAMPAVILHGSILLFLLGLADDFINIKPHNKLLGQIIVSSMVVFVGFRLNWFTSLTLDTMVTLVWIVGITNAFNLLDNMDGLCAGTAMVAALALAALYAKYDPSALSVSLIIAASCGAFLIYNFNPASIFMGDCGSLVIGFAIAVLSLYHGEFTTGSRLATVAVPLLILMVPLLDTSLVTIIRLLSGRKASTGGRDHTSHRLVLMGFSERGAVLFLYGIGVVSGIGGVFVSHSDTLTSPAVIIPIFSAMVLMGIYLSQLRVYPEKEFSVLRGKKFTPVLVELTYKKQILLVILDLGIVAFSYYLAYRLRFDGPEFRIFFKSFLKSLPVIIAVKLLVFYSTGIYRGFWQYISTPDVFLFVRSSFFATLLSIVSVTILYRFNQFSKGVFIIDLILTTLFLLGTRGSFRLFKETIKRKTLKGKRVLIYGAGRGGELLIREILNNKKIVLEPVGLLDDNRFKIGKRIQGFPILGKFDQLPQLIDQFNIEGVLISFNGNTSNQKAYWEAMRVCREKGLFLKTFSIDLKEVDLEQTTINLAPSKRKPVNVNKL